MTTPTFDVCVVGSLNLDVVARADRLPGPGETVIGHTYAEHAGGKGLNQAVAAARSGAKVAMVGAVGDDHAGDRLLEIARTEGIDVTSVARSADRATGRALISVDQQGENSIIVVPGANHAIDPGPTPAASVVLAQLEVPVEVVIAAFRAGRDSGATTILNPAPAATLPDALLAVTDIVVPNQHEVELLGGVAALHEGGVGTVVVTLGAAGVRVSAGAGAEWSLASHDVEVVDTTGAGDAFCGTLAARLAHGDTLDAALQWAVAAGALATTKQGAVPSLPHAADITDLVDSTSR